MNVLWTWLREYCLASLYQATTFFFTTFKPAMGI